MSLFNHYNPVDASPHSNYVAVRDRFAVDPEVPEAASFDVGICKDKPILPGEDGPIAQWTAKRERESRSVLPSRRAPP